MGRSAQAPGEEQTRKPHTGKGIARRLSHFSNRFNHPGINFFSVGPRFLESNLLLDRFFAQHLMTLPDVAQIPH
jgi:hypothetical protein